MTVKTNIYLAKLKQLQSRKQCDPSAMYLKITRAHINSILSPSWNLYHKAKRRKVTWDQYKTEFLKEMNNEKVRDLLEKLRAFAQTRDLYLICYEKDPTHCHRSLVKKLIDGEIEIGLY